MSSCSTDACGTGGWGGPLPGDPDNNSILTATPAFGGIDISWTYPLNNPHAVIHTILYRSSSADPVGAYKHKTVAGDFFFDRVSTGATFYYWIEIISINGTVGERIGPVWATARPLISDMIELLTGQIDAGVLAQSLKNDLSQISALNANLASEIFDRETGETSFATALEQVQAGIAQAQTFIANEINSRVTANEAIIESIDLLAVTLGSDIASVSTAMTAQIDAVSGAVNAMYTAKVTVNGLVGGFGLANDGASVEAGFDVDTFWVGRTSLDKKKPFIIQGGEVFINEAVINTLVFNKLRADDGSLIVEDGKMKAAYLDVENIVAGAAQSANYVAGTAGWKLGANGSLEANVGTFRGALAAATGTFSGTLTASAINAVDTLNVAGNAITVSSSAIGSSSGVSVTMSLLSGQPVLITAVVDADSNNLTLDFTRTGYISVGGIGTLRAVTACTHYDSAMTGYMRWPMLVITTIFTPPSSGVYTLTASASGSNTTTSITATHSKR